MANAQDIYKLELNEVLQLGDAYWRRVPGGWIVTETYEDPTAPPNSGAILRLHPVFVPEPENLVVDALRPNITVVQTDMPTQEGASY